MSYSLEHSAKGSTWKKHKYNRKDGKRYFYDEDAATVEDLTGIESPDFEGLADEMGKIPAVSKLREIMDGPMPIYSPNKNEESLVSKAQDAIEDAIDKNKEKRLAKQRRKNMQSDHQAYLEHSSGPWKKHKYFKKIGEGANAVYKYAKSVPGKVEDAVDNARWDAEEKIYNANEKLKEKSGKNARDRWQEEERRLNSARELDKDFREGDKKWFESDTSKARSTREIANEKKAVRQRNQMQAEYISNRRATARGAKQIYDQTAMGKAESAINKMKSRVAKAKKKLKHDGMDDYAATVEYGEALIDQMFGRE